MEPKPKSNALGELVVPGLSLIFGLAFFLQTGDAPDQVLLWPFITCGIAMLFWLPIVWKFIPKPSTWASGLNLAWLWGQGRRVSFILLATLGYLILLPWLGFTLGNLVFMLAVFRVLGGKRWIINLAVAGGIAGFLHVALIELMQLNLPRLELAGLVL